MDDLKEHHLRKLMENLGQNRREVTMDAEKKPGQPEEQEAVFTSGDSGDLAGPGTRVGAIPHGVEVLLKKASVDPEFRKLLLEERGEAAHTIGLELTDAEREMLAHIPAKQLEQIINNTKVKPENRLIFLGVVGALMLAALIGGIQYLGRCIEVRFESAGARIDEPK